MANGTKQFLVTAMDGETPKISTPYPRAHLLCLPAEIRTQILQQLLTGSINIVQKRSCRRCPCDLRRAPSPVVLFSRELIPRDVACPFCLSNGCPYVVYCEHGPIKRINKILPQYPAKHACSNDVHGNIEAFPLPIQVLRVCRQLYIEGRAAMDRSEFVLSDRWNIWDIASVPDDEYKRFYRIAHAKIVIPIEGGDSRLDFEPWFPQHSLTLKRFPNLRQLTFHMHCSLVGSLEWCHRSLRSKMLSNCWDVVKSSRPVKVEFKLMLVLRADARPSDQALSTRPSDKAVLTKFIEMLKILERDFQDAIDDVQAGGDEKKIKSRFSACRRVGLIDESMIEGGRTIGERGYDNSE